MKAGVQTVVDVRIRPDRASMGTYVKAKTSDKGIEALLGEAGIRYRSLPKLATCSWITMTGGNGTRRAACPCGRPARVSRLADLSGPICLLCAEKRRGVPSNADRPVPGIGGGERSRAPGAVAISIPYHRIPRNVELICNRQLVFALGLRGLQPVSDPDLAGELRVLLGEHVVRRHSPKRGERFVLYQAVIVQGMNEQLRLGCDRPTPPTKAVVCKRSTVLSKYACSSARY